ncbi:bifunctional adenosylcobinamide kinase/adenosylcobinamide-phosphate guanylyltransferase [Clostridium fermenticellae]|uniref:Adenosylcobinamide kinase n=1 Tax=Clostridium fermenticellae TaxID=2068654 RepID=A0A386H225_9CLOT|nr:bifunctional adenosylcobinamide kinase/adenosylcobinamide-phosphate guanylyltransferase [Clostridium fermenticellae]AYD39730.1 bifunctional adenosylcobinamide kinase/adenosylcobinamide-phosphate guanylyltransferase [Clostridium fermenticellae]
MGNVVLITGGSRSGKSGFAEKLLKDKDDVLYIATAVVTDLEMKRRVEIHRNRRNCKWTTYEGHKNFDIVLRDYNEKYIMFECVGTMITDLMLDENCDFENMSVSEIDSLEKKINLEIDKLIKIIRNENRNLIIITNEVGCGIVPEYRMGRIFSDILGRINQFLGQVSDEVYMVSCGIPLKLK